MTTPSATPDTLEYDAPQALGLRTIPSGFPMWMVWLLVRGLLVLGVLAGALVFASATLPSLFGLKSMVFSSGSMAPTIDAGNAVLVMLIAAITAVNLLVLGAPFGGASPRDPSEHMVVVNGASGLRCSLPDSRNEAHRVSRLERPEVHFGACPHDAGTMVRRYGETGVVWRCVTCDYTRRQ